MQLVFVHCHTAQAVYNGNHGQWHLKLDPKSGLWSLVCTLKTNQSNE